MSTAAASLPPGWHEALDPNYNHPYWYGFICPVPHEYCYCLSMVAVHLACTAGCALFASCDTTLVACVSLNWATKPMWPCGLCLL